MCSKDKEGGAQKELKYLHFYPENSDGGSQTFFFLLVEIPFSKKAFDNKT